MPRRNATRMVAIPVVGVLIAAGAACSGQSKGSARPDAGKLCSRFATGHGATVAWYVPARSARAWMRIATVTHASSRVPAELSALPPDTQVTACTIYVRSRVSIPPGAPPPPSGAVNETIESYFVLANGRGFRDTIDTPEPAATTTR